MVETAFWLEMVLAAEMLSPEDVEGLDQEADELLRIGVASIPSAKRTS